MTVRKEHKGLSPSSLSLLQACQKKYYYKKIAKLPVDKDYEEDTSVFNLGKAFHRGCEDSVHMPSTLSLDQLSGICELYDLDVQEYFPVVYAMLLEYEKVHIKSKLSVVACEVEMETDVFYGICDVVLKDDEGGWYIGDLKTASSFTPAQVNGLLHHTQLNLYAANAPILARKFNLDLGKFRGCRYRVTTKSKLQRKPLEAMKDYIARLQLSIKSQDYFLPLERMRPKEVYATHKDAMALLKSTDEKDYKRNYGNCFSYYRPCEHYSQCHGNLYSQCGGVEVITN